MTAHSDITAPDPVATIDRAVALSIVRKRVAQAAVASGRTADDVTLVAVSKTQPVSYLHDVLSAGQRVFGESKVQEAKSKWPDLKEKNPDLYLHMIGHLQTNKVRDAVRLFDVIETLDRPGLAEALAAEIARQRRHVRCFIQVNVDTGPHRSGIAPGLVGDFLEMARGCGLDVVGLMTVPAPGIDPVPVFRLVADIARHHNLSQLSMGMSGDFELAIREGATCVRVGTAIFGNRPALAVTPPAPPPCHN